MRKRRQYWIDGRVQGALVWRVVIYWMHCLITVAFMTMIWLILTAAPRSSGDLWHRLVTHCGPALVASFLLLPLVIIDAVRMSNRFVGPLFRLRRAMRALADGKGVPDQTFRQNDFWQDLATDFNRLSHRVRELESALESRDAHESHSDASLVESAV